MSVVAGAGYSGTPLPKKLGMDKARHICILNAAPDYVRSLGVLASELYKQAQARGWGQEGFPVVARVLEAMASAELRK